MQLNDDYDPIQDFYGCNPRSIFEGGIWYALQEHGIPCGKSDPLNVAKNANQLNEAWAQGRRPQSAAIAVVEYLRLVIEADPEERLCLVNYFFYRLVAYSQSITGIHLKEVRTNEHSNQTIGNQLVSFTLAFPESGALPQLLVAQLLSALLKDTTTMVCGVGESVFGTNTTSKKPADLWLERDGVPLVLYEVTVKNISQKRLDDNIESLRSLGYLDLPLTFICRLSNDTKSLSIPDGCVKYRGKQFDFIDYRCFCLAIFALLTQTQCMTLVSTVSNFVQNKNTSVKAKNGWNEFFGYPT